MTTKNNSGIERLVNTNETTKLTKIIELQQNSLDYNIITTKDEIHSNFYGHEIEFKVSPKNKLETIEELNNWYNKFKEKVGIKDNGHFGGFNINSDELSFFSPANSINERLPSSCIDITMQEYTIKDKYILDNSKKLFRDDWNYNKTKNNLITKTWQIDSNYEDEFHRDIRIDYHANDKLSSQHNNLVDLNEVLNEEEINKLFLPNPKDKKRIHKLLEKYNSPPSKGYIEKISDWYKGFVK